jgi:hypothetical protein
MVEFGEFCGDPKDKIISFEIDLIAFYLKLNYLDLVSLRQVILSYGGYTFLSIQN